MQTPQQLILTHHIPAPRCQHRHLALDDSGPIAMVHCMACIHVVDYGLAEYVKR